MWRHRRLLQYRPGDRAVAVCVKRAIRWLPAHPLPDHVADHARADNRLHPGHPRHPRPPAPGRELALRPDDRREDSALVRGNVTISTSWPDRLRSADSWGWPKSANSLSITF